MPLKRLAHPSGKDFVLPPVRPNLGLEIAYRRKLDRLVDEMQNSILYWIKATYRANPPRLAADSPASELQDQMNKLSRRWNKRFNVASKELARYFARSALQRSDEQLKAILKKAGFTVDFKLSPEVRDIFAATLEQQVGLIKSIAAQHLSDVQGDVMRSVQAGHDMATLTKQLEHRYKLTRERAALIARDQTNKATATITRVRQSSVGITHAIWLHSGATGKHARPEHVAFSKGRHDGPNSGPVYDVRKGAFLEGKWTFPGYEINCFTSETVIPYADGIEKAYRRFYSGKLIEVVTSSGVLFKATPNHPILTSKGWIAIGLLKKGDYVVEIADQRTLAARENNNYWLPTIADVFSSVSESGITQKPSTRNDFHGDGTESQIDTVDAARSLSINIVSSFAQSLDYDIFHRTANTNTCKRSLFFGLNRILHSSASLLRRFCSKFMLFRRFILCDNSVRFGLCSESASGLNNFSSDYASVNVKFSAQCENAGSAFISLPQLFDIQRRYGIRVPLSYASVIRTTTNENWSGHVYNLQTTTSCYVANGVIAHNCRCVSRSIIPGL